MMKFFPGAYVFPGGALDSSEDNSKIEGYRNAALRESHEEIGLPLKFVSSDDLLFLSRWLTPEFEKKRFDTFFFLTQLKSNFDIKLDEVEITDYLWIELNTAVAKSLSGEIFLPPPTFWNLCLVKMNLKNILKSLAPDTSKVNDPLSNEILTPFMKESGGKSELALDDSYLANLRRFYKDIPRFRCFFENGISYTLT